MVGGRVLLAAIVLLGAAPTAEAEPRGDGAGDSWRPERVEVLVYGAEGLDELGRRALEDAVVQGLGRTAVKRAEAASERGFSAPGSAADELSKADQKLEQALKQVRNLELGSAAELLDGAADAYVRNLPELRRRDSGPGKLTEVYVQLAIVHFLEGNEPAATDALGRALVLDPSIEYSADRFPPQLEQFVNAFRSSFQERGHGRLRIAAGGVDGAVVYINGNKQGRAPTERGGLPAGPNFVQVRASGYRPALLDPVVEGGKARAVTARLEPAPSAVRGAFAGTRKHAGESTPPKELERPAKELGADGLLLVVPVSTESSYRLSAYLYDLRRGRLVSRARREVPRQDFESEVAELSHAVWSRARWESLPAPPPKREPGALGWIEYQWNRASDRRYFWPAVGVAAGAAALGIAFYVHSRRLSAEKRFVVLPIVGSF